MANTHMHDIMMNIFALHAGRITGKLKEWEMATVIVAIKRMPKV